MGYADHLRSHVPQSEALPGQVKNSAGGHSFQVSKWTRLERFLILGSEGGSYYAGERKLTLDNVKCVEECLAENGTRVVDLLVAVSDGGRAPKNDPALLALAFALKKGDDATKRAAHDAVPKVARIGTHLFHLAEFVKKLGGWGRLTAHAFGDWYRKMPVDRLALQAIKYQSRDGWSHGDVLRKSHPIAAGTPEEELRVAIWDWMVNGWEGVGEKPHPDETLVKIWAFEKAKKAKGRELIKLIADYGLPHECVPNDAKNDPDVWEAMLPSMGVTALIRNLGKMTAVGLLKPMSAEVSLVAKRLGDVDELTKSRVHPLSILVALRTYAQGHGDKGSLSWAPVQKIVDALDSAFYTAFKAVEPTGKRFLLGLDVSGSMSSLMGNMPLTCREGSTAMALVTANVEEEHHIMAFESGSSLAPAPFGSRTRLDDACAKTEGFWRGGGTDCAQPMLYALKNKIPVDAFCVYTDSETWHGDIHPVTALKDYRQKMGIPAKLVVIGMVANPFTIADPDDAGMLDVVGFDTATPGLIADFARQ